jgi:hypothetical protein
MLTSGELAAAIRAEPEGTDRWKDLCREADRRVAFGSLHPRHLPDGYEPGTVLDAPDDGDQVQASTETS